MSHARPDCVFQVSQVAQVTQEIILSDCKAWIKRINNAVKYALENPLIKKYPILDLKSLQVMGLSDASFAVNIIMTIIIILTSLHSIHYHNLYSITPIHCHSLYTVYTPSANNIGTYRYDLPGSTWTAILLVHLFMACLG